MKLWKLKSSRVSKKNPVTWIGKSLAAPVYEDGPVSEFTTLKAHYL